MNRLSRIATVSAIVGVAGVSQALFFNSGINPGPPTSMIAYGAVDSKFQVRKTAGAINSLFDWRNPFVVTPSPEDYGAVWIGDDTLSGPSLGTRSFASRWLSPLTTFPGSSRARGIGLDSHVEGVYQYRYQFWLYAEQATFLNSTAGVTGRWSSDNGSSVLWNGVQVGSIGSETAFREWTTFQLSGFKPGMNTLTFEVRNFANTASNPTGLRVEFTSVPAGVPPVPEPFTMALGAGALALAAARKRRKAKAKV